MSQDIFIHSTFLLSITFAIIGNDEFGIEKVRLKESLGILLTEYSNILGALQLIQLTVTVNFPFKVRNSAHIEESPMMRCS